MAHIWNSWLLVAFIAPFFWALVNIFDVYFVSEIYEDEYEGTVIMGLFQVIPWLMVPFVRFEIPALGIIGWSILGGLSALAAMFFYFKALFHARDIATIQVFWNLVALAVPILAFILIGERLTKMQYLGILVAFSGVVFITLDKSIRGKNIKRLAAIMSAAILFFSLSMIIQEHVYSQTNFFGGLIFFSVGYFVGGVLLFGFRRTNMTRRLVHLNKKYFFWFIGAELVTQIGVVASQRAIFLSPSVSFVALIESLQPAFILILSALLFALLGLSFVKFGKRDVLRKLYAEQIAAKKSKIFAIVIMAIGIFLINK
ncbi:MAG: EamA family transporter [Patescibacteria group bacterium]|nr:EamA family transporter [Patescibacteria group bacterium]